VANDDNKSPEAHMAMKARMKGGPRHKPTSLQVMVKGIERNLWPTPRSTDGSHGGRVTPRKSRNGGNLIEAVSMALYPTPTASGACNAGGSNSRKTAKRNGTYVSGSLNPEWVEWLMGLPLGFTALKHWVTRSSGKSRTSSGEQS
jgi:hypothetical protein